MNTGVVCSAQSGFCFGIRRLDLGTFEPETPNPEPQALTLTLQVPTIEGTRGSGALYSRYLEG